MSNPSEPNPEIPLRKRRSRRGKVAHQDEVARQPTRDNLASHFPMHFDSVLDEKLRHEFDIKLPRIKDFKK